MSKSGVNTGFAKCFILFMALVIMVEGFIYLALSLWGLMLIKCSNQVSSMLIDDKISQNPFRFIVELMYLKQQDCGAISFNANNNETYLLTVDWSISEQITYRENVFFVVYTVISALWILSSILVIITLCGRLTVCVTVLCFWPWFLFVIAGSVMDIIATVYHALDITHTLSTNDFLSYIGLRDVQTEILDNFKQYDSYYMLPAIVMTCLSSRVVLIWLLNVFGSFFCITLCQTIVNRMRNKKQRTKEIMLNGRSMRQQEQQRSALQEVNQQAIAQQQQAIAQQQQQQERQRNTETVIAAAAVELEELPSTNSQMSTYRNSEAHPGRLNYPPQTPTRSLDTQLSVASPLNNRYSSMEASQMAQSPVRVSAELRNQMPWSYINVQQQQQQKQQQQQQQKRVTMSNDKYD